MELKQREMARYLAHRLRNIIVQIKLAVAWMLYLLCNLELYLKVERWSIRLLYAEV
jgi:hypothetical protein